ncbi:MAG: RNB domain-containing ribonuclease [Acidimicrobiales bacterium]
MPTPKLAVAADVVRAAEVERGMARVRAELEVPDGFPDDVLAAADRAAGADAWRRDGRPDRTAVELVTIDPPGSRDLDQAFGAERRPVGGFRVWYAIADAAAFVEPGGAIDAECHRRGVTLYGPDRRDPLHPPSLGEGAASLLPDEDRPALLWSIDLDSAGAPIGTRFERALVRNREGAYSRAALDLVEALVLRSSVGERFAAAVVDVDDDRVQVQLREPAVIARARDGRGSRPGDEVEVVLRAADPIARRIDLEVV